MYPDLGFLNAECGMSRIWNLDCGMRIEKAKEIGFEDLSARVEVAEITSQETGRFTPCLVNAIGLSFVPPQLKVPNWHLRAPYSFWVSSNIKSEGRHFSLDKSIDVLSNR